MLRKVLFVGTIGGLIVILAQPVFTQNANNSNATIVGSWEFTATPSASSSEPSVPGLATFTSDGSLIEDDATELAPGHATPGHGIWQPSPAVPNLFLRFTNIVAHPDASHTTRRIVTMTVGLDSTGNEFSGGFSFEVVDPSGRVLTTGTGTIVAHRLVHPALP
jgi:hypothetical protein